MSKDSKKSVLDIFQKEEDECKKKLEQVQVDIGQLKFTLRHREKRAMRLKEWIGVLESYKKAIVGWERYRD